MFFEKNKLSEKMMFPTNAKGVECTDEWEKSHKERNLTDTITWTFHKVCICNCASPCLCVARSRGVLSATPGPSCRLPACPRILLGASHTWVAHSSWTLHIQIAVMNIIREERRGDVRGIHTNYTFICGCTNTHVWVHTNVTFFRYIVHSRSSTALCKWHMRLCILRRFDSISVSNRWNMEIQREKPVNTHTHTHTLKPLAMSDT